MCSPCCFARTVVKWAEVLLHRFSYLSRSVCSDFTSLIVKMNDMQLALVCRVLALLVNPAWNVQVHDSSHKFTKLVARLKRVEALMQRNHDLVIDHPQILHRYVNSTNNN